MMSVPTPTKVFGFEEARHCVEEHAAGLRAKGRDNVELLDSAGRVLAEAVYADRDFPPFRRAARDGYAVRAADLGALPATLSVIGEIKAGAPSEVNFKVGPGQAAAIMTGAAVPAGADSVVMVEYSVLKGTVVEISRGVKSGDNVVPVGAEATQLQCLLSSGMRMDHAAIAIAASVGKTQLSVFRKPQVGVLATGDEIVDIASLPGPNQIRNSNTYSLAAQVRTAGGEPVLLPIVPDEPTRLRESIARGLDADFLLLAGGVSMGKYDLVEQVLSELSAEFFFTGAQIQPGRPVVFGRVQRDDGAKYFLGLPGNPVSTMVTFELFARPMIEALAGLSPRKLVFLAARLKSEVKTKPGLKRFLPAVLSGEFEQAEVELVRWQGSGDIVAMAQANCYVVVPPDREQITAGEWVAILLR